MAKKQTVHDEWLAAQSYLAEAERNAGIDNALKELNERNAYTASSEENADDERQIVFLIPELELRKRVIYFQRECHRLCRADTMEELKALRGRLKNNGERIRRNHLWSSIFIGVLIVYVGNTFFGVAGALSGVVIAVLIGFDNILRGDRSAIADVDEAKKEIFELQKFLSNFGVDGIFSSIEEATGQQDENFTKNLYPTWQD